MATITKLKLSIKTGSESFSGTDARIYLALGGRAARRLYLLPTRREHFESGGLNIFVAGCPEGPDLDDLVTVLLVNGMNGTNPAWRVLWLRLEAADVNGRAWLLSDSMPERWLDHTADRAPAMFVPLRTPFEPLAGSDPLGGPTCVLHRVE